ncbi:MAG: class I SAM-dependent methyltransferase, partial [Candidatus Acidiferrales bacterium]
TPERVMEAFRGYQRTAAMKAAIELDLFTLIGAGKNSVAELAAAAHASERGIRILCDNLAVEGFLNKAGAAYTLAPDAQVFLDRKSPSCINDAAAGFFASQEVIRSFDSLAEAVRKGGTAAQGEGMMDPNDPLWVDFAVSMVSVQRPMASGLAKVLNAEAGNPWKVLDIASGHGLFGVVLAARNPNAEIYSQDWAPVLEVAQKNADAAGVSARFHKIPGDAFKEDLGSGYDLVLLTNFLQLLDVAAIEIFLKKVYRVLKPGGRVVTVGFIPNEDRISPPAPGLFSLMMLATTPGGDAYTFSDYDRMFRAARFTRSEQVALPNVPQQLIISTK